MDRMVTGFKANRLSKAVSLSRWVGGKIWRTVHLVRAIHVFV